jgi:RNA polymerase sigma factor (sigma-70 family)
MSSSTSGATLRQLRDLFRGGTAVGLSDAELLARFAASHDETAFEGLVARHGPMVLATCRAVLRHEHDAEDAFQAAFLVLARRAASIQTGDFLGGWLHRVAYRVAVQANIEAKRRRRLESEVSTMEIPAASRGEDELELRAILHDEIDRLPERERLPVVLCDVEGLTYEQAAGRLHWTAPALYHRLAKARRRLRDRLIRRGVTGTLVGAVMASSRATATMVPAEWAEAAVAAATVGPTSTAAAALSRAVMRSMLMTQLTFAATAALVAAAVASVGIVAVRGSRANDMRLAPLAAAVGQEPPSAVKAPTAAKPNTSPRAATEGTASAPSAGRVADPGTQPPGRASGSDPNAEQRVLTVEARDLLTDSPVPDVRLQFSTERGSTVSATTDGSGTARFVFFTGITDLNVDAVRDGFVRLAIRWFRESSSPTPPEHLLFQMEKATTIGGCVLDQDQRPIAGATVVIQVNKAYPKSRQRVDIQLESTRTDATGHWSHPGVPEKPDSVSLGAYHHLCLPDWPFYVLEEMKPLSALFDHSAVLRLESGTRVEGTVVAPDGRPVSDALVCYGEGAWRVANGIPPVKTDGQGKFTLGIKPGTVAVLTARRADFGPVLERIRVGTIPQSMKLVLQPPHTLSGRVVDRAGKPIARADLRVKSWRGSESLDQDLASDSDGRFAWNDAPGDEVRVSVSAAGYSHKDDMPLVPDTPHVIMLTPATTIQGTVVDGETGQRLPKFSLVLGFLWNPGERFVWARGWGIDRDSRKASGSFEYTFGEPFHQCLVQVTAEGYLPADSGLFSPSPDGSARTFTFRLTKAKPIRGNVRNPDGSPARDGYVYLVPADDDLPLENGDVPEYRRKSKIHAKLAQDGRFSLPPQKEPCLLVALSDAGFVVARRRELDRDLTLSLQPWARVTGTVRLDNKPAVDLSLSADPDSTPAVVEGEPQIDHRLFFKTDANGRFELTRLMPGRYIIGRRVANGAPRRFWFVNMATIDVKSGEVYDLKIGESGRRVTGRLVLPSGDGWMIRKASIEARHSTDPSHSIGVQVFDDGRFAAEDLQAGDYLLRIVTHEPPKENACGWGRQIAVFSHEFTVIGKAGESAQNLGSLRPVQVGGRPLQVGDIAPDFAVKTLDGKDLTLAHLKGKIVLLDFWATWCAPCVAEVPNLKAVHQAFAATPQFAMVSLSLDEKAADARSFVLAQKLGWLQGLIGPDSSVAAAYDAMAIPATILIGADGRVVARDLTGEKLKTAIALALKP